MISRRQFLTLAPAGLLIACHSPRPQYNTVVIEAGQYVDQLYAAWWTSKAKLEAVGAPVRDWKGLVAVSFKTGYRRGILQSRPAWGIDGDDGPILYGQTIPWKPDRATVWLSLTPDGRFQPEVAQGEFAHFHLRMDKAFDYPWMTKAGLMIKAV